MAATPTDTAENNGAGAADLAQEAEATASSPDELEEEVPDPEETPEPATDEEAPPATDATPAPAPAQTQVVESKKWPGWPGDNVFRLVVPVLKVGSIIGRKGELIKKLCEETRARVRVLEGALGTSDRIVSTLLALRLAGFEGFACYLCS